MFKWFWTIFSLDAPVILETAAIDKRSSVAIAWALKACQYWAQVLRPNPQNVSVSENSARLNVGFPTKRASFPWKMASVSRENVRIRDSGF